LLAATLVVTTLGYATSASADTHEAQTYQIVKATDSRVWRLNTRTGEIAVCSLDGEQLMCTSSVQAITPPTRTYAELEAERRQREQLDAQQREEKRKRSLAMLDLMMKAFRDLAIAGSAVGDVD
jgi:hypothetical protein